MPKLAAALDRNDEPELIRWGKFLSANTDTELDALAQEDPVMKQAKEALETLSKDAEARWRAEQREMALISYQLDMGKMRQEGIAEGEARGRAEGEARGRAEGEATGKLQGKAAVLRNLLACRFGDLPEASLQVIARASEADLDRWLERVLTASSLDSVLAS